MCKLYDPLIASNNFIERGMRESCHVSPMKLQKLLYFFYRDYFQETHKPLFSERFEAWPYGPVLSSVYHYFKSFRDRSIDSYYTDCNGKSHKINDVQNTAETCSLNKVWEKYKGFSGIELSQMTHQEGTAWYKAWVGKKTFLEDTDIGVESAP